MSLKDKLKSVTDRLQPIRETAGKLPEKLKAEGLKGYAIRTAVMNTVCLAAAVLVCHLLLRAGATVPALCMLVIAAGLIVHSNILFAMDVREPIRSLTELCRRIADGGYGLQAPKGGDDEIGELTDVINHLSAKISEYEKTQANQ